MGRSQSKTKTKLLATRVTPKIQELIKQMAYREGLYVSEWIRNVILNELKKNGMLTTTLMEPMHNQNSEIPFDDL
jgi:hypothetical protein